MDRRDLLKITRGKSWVPKTIHTEMPVYSLGANPALQQRPKDLKGVHDKKGTDATKTAEACLSIRTIISKPELQDPPLAPIAIPAPSTL